MSNLPPGKTFLTTLPPITFFITTLPPRKKIITTLPPYTQLHYLKLFALFPNYLTRPSSPRTINSPAATYTAQILVVATYINATTHFNAATYFNSLYAIK
jgi:hypothetical protein